MVEIVISEPDLEAAVAHLRQLPRSVTAQMPLEWSRKRFLDTLKATLRVNPRAKGVLPVAPGVWALIQPYGVDLAGSLDDTSRRQIWILLRSVGTDPAQLTILEN
ncbi:hypothetical protein [Paraburkholderia sediminicola]|uniref:hypothetical protein n=1 Tax=Paraburkholderia sediminicola TaxID=458836 RepID=UPI0038B8EE96